MTNNNENRQVDYQARYLEADNRVNDLEINKQQLHHLLIHVEEQLEEVEGIYQMVKEYSKRPNTNDYMNKALAELRSLIEVSQDHNQKFLNEQ